METYIVVIIAVVLIVLGTSSLIGITTTVNRIVSYLDKPPKEAPKERRLQAFQHDAAGIVLLKKVPDADTDTIISVWIPYSEVSRITSRHSLRELESAPSDTFHCVAHDIEVDVVFKNGSTETFKNVIPR